MAWSVTDESITSTNAVLVSASILSTMLQIPHLGMWTSFLRFVNFFARLIVMFPPINRVGPMIVHRCYAVLHISMPNEKFEKLKLALRESLGENSSEELVADILKTLDKQKVFRYHNENVVNLLSTPGRVICSLMEDNTMTQRALAVYLDMSEAMIDKTIKSLIVSGLITKTKVSRQNIYKVNYELVLKHPDIQHLLGSINSPPPTVDENSIF